MKTIIDMVCIPFQMIELTSPALKAENVVGMIELVRFFEVDHRIQLHFDRNQFRIFQIQR